MIKQGISEETVILQNHVNGISEWIIFSNPAYIISTESVDKVAKCLSKIEGFIEQGYYAAGYLAYEAASGIDRAYTSKISTKKQVGYPLLWFGIYKEYQPYPMSFSEDDDIEMSDWLADISGDLYKKNVTTIREHIQSGDTYQVNYTFRLRSTFSSEPWIFAKALFRAQSSDCCAYINLGSVHICSASPELFFKYSEGNLVSRPMKGTVGRGDTMDSDNENKKWLKHSAKNRAENAMIVDMIRNDMGRFAETGSVCVDNLFAVERYPTVFQMTSTVTAKTKLSAVAVLKNMFPCASITGAPKVKTMEIIKELEASPRGVYTGSIGYFSPDDKAQFNVAIRTVVLNTQTKYAEYGVGGGIVWDSTIEDEFNECKLKADILLHRQPPFELLETLLWRPFKGYVFLDLHLRRMEKSALYFEYFFDKNKIIDELLKIAENFEEAQRVRLLLNRNGGASISSEIIATKLGSKVSLSREKLHSPPKYLLHKTTYRHRYDEELAQHQDASDVILVNGDGEITESCTANIVIKKNGELLTPNIKCGLLNGIFRSELLRTGLIREALIYVDDLLSAEEVYLISSVRAWMKLKTTDGRMGWEISEQFDFDFDARNNDL